MTKLRRLTRRFWRWSQQQPDHCVLLLRDMLDRGASIEEASDLPRTSQPSVGDFQQVYEQVEAVESDPAVRKTLEELQRQQK